MRAIDRTRVVVSPKRADLVLTTHIPYVELDILIGDTLDVEANRGDGCHLLVGEFKLVEDCWRGGQSACSVVGFPPEPEG